MTNHATNSTPPGAMRTLVAGVLRRSITALPSGDTTSVVRAVRSTLAGRPRRDLIHFTATLAWAAAHLASELPDDRREHVLATLEASPDTLVGAGVAALVRSTVSGAQ